MSITFQKDGLNISLGIGYPGEGQPVSMQWSSSNSSVATIKQGGKFGNSGVLKAISPGQTKICVEASSVTDCVTITVRWVTWHWKWAVNLWRTGIKAQRKELKQKLPKTSVDVAGQVKEDAETQKIRAEIEQLNKEEASEIAKIQADTKQKIASYDYETNKIIKELLKKKPSEMTQEEFQTYLLIDKRT